jgi:hypothetical protein
MGKEQKEKRFKELLKLREYEREKLKQKNNGKNANLSKEK